MVDWHLVSTILMQEAVVCITTKVFFFLLTVQLGNPKNCFFSITMIFPKA